jgi:hypothetical protein
MFDAIVEAPGIQGNKRSYNNPVDFFNTIKVFIEDEQDFKFYVTFRKDKNVPDIEEEKMTYEKGKELIIKELQAEPLTVKKLIMRINMSERTAYWYLMKMVKEKLVGASKSDGGKLFTLKDSHGIKGKRK